MAQKPNDADVLIVGAGPTGLVLALWLTKLGVSVRIVDKLSTAGTTSRALAVQARTLEFYQQIGLAEAVVARGHKVPALNLWVRSAHAARVPLESLGQGLTPFPFPIIFPQDEHEMLLIERLHAIGVEVERVTELTVFEEKDAAVHATLRTGGTEEVRTYAYIAGCDGARSRVREVLEVGFPGGTYDHLFYVADVEAAGAPMNGELHVDLDDADFLAVFPLSDSGRARLIGSVRDAAAKDHEHLEFEDVRDRAIHNLKLEVKHVNWFSTYRVHHRVANRFRHGRAFLLGDAAHIHSPVGGQGMNTGIGDAVNLAWKLASVLKRSANVALLDSYEPERIAFAQRLVATTDRAFTAVISPGVLIRLLRTRLLPLFAPLLFRIPVMRRFMFRTVSQIAVNYRGSALSSGSTGRIRGGDRLPWVGDNFAPLATLNWQIHVYGIAGPRMQALSARQGITLNTFAWQSLMQKAGLRRNAAYLVRPDGYVAVMSTNDDPAAIAKYLSEKNVVRVLS
jgi:2-polyprenyl-6-methoxyphenol hydroxylase-like FAD-dependent oxidoreductase